tara:strand:- start:33 stop:203 length:171 start_codon:yes stop_codon:yes gene_type:complete
MAYRVAYLTVKIGYNDRYNINEIVENLDYGFSYTPEPEGEEIIEFSSILDCSTRAS